MIMNMGSNRVGTLVGRRSRPNASDAMLSRTNTVEESMTVYLQWYIGKLILVFRQRTVSITLFSLTTFYRAFRLLQTFQPCVWH